MADVVPAGEDGREGAAAPDPAADPAATDLSPKSADADDKTSSPDAGGGGEEEESKVEPRLQSALDAAKSFRDKHTLSNRDNLTLEQENSELKARLSVFEAGSSTVEPKVEPTATAEPKKEKAQYRFYAADEISDDPVLGMKQLTSNIEVLSSVVADKLPKLDEVDSFGAKLSDYDKTIAELSADTKTRQEAEERQTEVKSMEALGIPKEQAEVILDMASSESLEDRSHSRVPLADEIAKGNDLRVEREKQVELNRRLAIGGSGVASAGAGDSAGVEAKVAEIKKITGYEARLDAVAKYAQDYGEEAAGRLHTMLRAETRT